MKLFCKNILFWPLVLFRNFGLKLGTNGKKIWKMLFLFLKRSFLNLSQCSAYCIVKIAAPYCLNSARWIITQFSPFSYYSMPFLLWGYAYRTLPKGHTVLWNYCYYEKFKLTVSFHVPFLNLRILSRTWAAEQII